MSSTGRGRGYSGRHHMRETRPGDEGPDMDAVRTLSELSPRSPVSDQPKPDTKQDRREANLEQKDEDDRFSNLRLEDEAAMKELLTIDEQYTPLLVLLDQFLPGEDGIAFNRKLRQFESTISSLCPDEPRLLRAFATFRAAALMKASTARRLAAVGASFTRQQRQQFLRSALLNVVMQGTYAKLDVLERTNPMFLINAANLIGDYFAEARLCNGNKVHILASPLLHYMKALLMSNDIRAHKSLATQLMQNGRELLTVLPTEIDEMSISIRVRLITPPPVTLIWLLLSADLCLNKFLPLPNSLQQFYASHLELAEECNFSEVNYGSWKKSPEKTESEPESSGFDKINLSNMNLDEDVMKPKLRPILGAGAALMRQEGDFGFIKKRYDLNTWRQNEEEEPVFDPTVLPPNFGNFSQSMNANQFADFAQGDGVFIQNNYQESQPSYKGDGMFNQVAKNEVKVQEKTEKVNSETQKTARKPIENWRQSDPNSEEEKRKSWQKSPDNDIVDRLEGQKGNIRNLRGRQCRRDSDPDKKRSVADVPRSQKYWGHDDRCDIDYNS